MGNSSNKKQYLFKRQIYGSIASTSFCVRVDSDLILKMMTWAMILCELQLAALLDRNSLMCYV
uniref:Ovule protein n=1 Tax=Heterorhabditis bacteriophora TaxID=37862 RepID=A0A1I7WJ24_HETBA